ncbi:MAG: hypothetical protein ACOC3Z_02165 [Nanoarchaeota archaeon]
MNIHQQKSYLEELRRNILNTLEKGYHSEKGKKKLKENLKICNKKIRELKGEKENENN